MPGIRDGAHDDGRPSLASCTSSTLLGTEQQSSSTIDPTPEQVAEACQVSTFVRTTAMTEVLANFYISLPCPETLVPLQAANTWKMDVLIPGDMLGSTHPMIYVYFTLWDESRGRAFGFPELGNDSSIMLFANTPLVMMDDAVVNIQSSVGILSMVSLPDAFAVGGYYLHPGSNKEDILGQQNLAAISKLRFKPHKLIVHDTTLAEGLSALQHFKGYLHNFSSTAVTLLSTLKGLEGSARMHFLGVCASCKIMGVCGAKTESGEIKSIKRCSSCCKRYYCNRKCQKQDWPVNQLECKGKTRVKARFKAKM